MNFEKAQLRLRIRAYQEHPVTDCLGKLDGDAICGFGACLCKGSSPWWCSYLRVSHDSGRMRCFCWYPLPRLPQECPRAWQAIVLAAVLFAVGIAAFAVSSNITLSLVSLVVAGFGVMTLIASCNTVLQTIVEEDKRGRVMSFFTVAFIGVAPFW